MQSSLYGQADNAEEAIQAANASLSPRQRELETLERFANGTQYEGRANWWNPDVPLWDKAPCIVYLQTKGAIQSNTDLVLGERGFPVITSNPGEDDSEADGLDKDQSKDVDRAIRELSDRVRFRSVSRQALEHGQQAKSVAGVVGTREGHPFIEIVRSRWCEPQFDVNRRVTQLEIRYPFVEWKKQPDGHWKLAAKLFRRIIDQQSDTTFLSIEAPKDGREPPAGAWVPDPTRTVEHKLGYCPVVWYAHMRECSTVNDYDGEAIHQHILPAIEGLDFALSQKHRAVLSCGDPQIIEAGVEPGYNPSGATGTISVPSTPNGGSPSSGNAQTGSYAQTGGKKGRVKSPGLVWQYPDKDTKVTYLTLAPGAIEALDSHCADLRNKNAESLQVVVLDPQNLKLAAAISGKAIEQLRARQFDRCDQIRDDVGTGWLLPAIKMLLRVSLSAKIALPSVKKAAAALSKFVEDDISSPMLFLRWPNGYVAPDPADEQLIVTTAVAAKESGAITRRMLLQKIAPIYSIDDLAQAEEALDEEKADNQAEALEHATNMAKAAPPAPAVNDNGKAPPNGTQPKPAAE